jgi:hypothetical protein
MNTFQNKFEARFYFIDDETLRRNLGDTLEYVTELTAISETYSSVVKTGFFKTVIVCTASIIEAILHFYLKKRISRTIYKNDWKYTDIKTFKVISTTPKKEIIMGYREKEVLNLEELIFNDLVKTLHSENLWQPVGLENKVDDLRKKRNKIHLMTLGSLDRAYSKEMVDEIFKTAREVILMVEAGLSN